MSKVAISGNASGTGTLTIAAPNTNSNYQLDLPTASGTVQVSGNPISGTTGSFSTTVGVGGATPSASGAGITFPATQSASTDANTLDDYEEGTFTPVVIGSTSAGTGTYVAQVGFYTKVGRLVTVQGYMDWSAHTGTGNFQLGNLPFTPINTTNAFSFGALYVDRIALSANNVIEPIIVSPNSTNMIVQQYPVAGGVAAVVPIDTSGAVGYVVSYIV